MSRPLSNLPSAVPTTDSSSKLDPALSHYGSPKAARMSMVARWANLALVGALSLLLPMSARAAKATLSGVSLLGVRAFADGTTRHLIFPANTIRCTNPNDPSATPRLDLLRVAGNGAQSVESLALAALLSGRTVDIDYDDMVAPGNSFCQVISLRISSK